jgi:hypothetical protein
MRPQSRSRPNKNQQRQTEGTTGGLADCWEQGNNNGSELRTAIDVDRSAPFSSLTDYRVVLESAVNLGNDEALAMHTIIGFAMHKIIGLRLADRSISWQVQQGQQDQTSEDGLTITFSPLSGGERTALRALKELIETNSVSWLKPSRSVWQIDMPDFRRWFPSISDASFLDGLEWLDGVVSVKPTVTQHPRVAHIEPLPFTGGHTSVNLTIYQEDYLLTKATKLFLSHKGANKSLVWQYFNVLKELGFEPWLDDDAMPAGTLLHRGIQQGMKDSCAAIFFITPDFHDVDFIAKEIDYAIEEKRLKQNRFAIVSLLFTSAEGKTGVVPSLLTPYVYKHPKTDPEALLEIIRAIPLEVGPVDWRAGL